MDLSELNKSMNKDNLYFCSTNMESVSSLQLDKRVKSRCYCSQFTINDETLVSVDRREEYRPTENKVTIEVDISLGICDNDESNNKQYIVRLHDMASDNPWVLRMINYDTFVDKDITNSIRDDAMEPNKLYLLQKRHTAKTEDKFCYSDSYDKPPLSKRNLRSTCSQFYPPFDIDSSIQVKKDDILRNELLISTGQPQDNDVNDKSYTSCVDIELARTSKDQQHDHKEAEGFTSNVTMTKNHFITIIQPAERSIENVDSPTFKQSSITPILVDTEDFVDSVDAEESKPIDKVIEIPFAEETEDEGNNKINTTKTLSKSLQYYLPIEKNKEGSTDLHSDVSTCSDSSTESDSVCGKFEYDLISAQKPNYIATLDEFNDMSEDCEPESSKEFCDDVDYNCKVVNDKDIKEIPSFASDEPIFVADLIYQENMVLQVNAACSPDVVELDLSQIRKETVDIPKGQRIESKLKSASSPATTKDQQHEESPQFSSNVVIPPKPQPLKVKLITSDNYTDIVDMGRMIKEENLLSSANKENELDKESSISCSSGSMIVKDILSDENMEFFVTHNNLDALYQEQDFNDELGLVEEEEEYSNCNSVDKVPENEEYETGTEVDEYETDATSASSFTTSMDVQNKMMKDLVKTPIESTPGQFEKFLVERERRMSEVHKSSLPVSHVSGSSSSLSDDNYEEDFDNVKQSPPDKLEVLLSKMPSVPKDRNSPLTSVSSTSSVSSSDAENNFGDTNTLIKKKQRNGMFNANSASSVSGSSETISSSYTDELIQNDYENVEPKKRDVVTVQDKIDGRKSSSSDWSSSSNEDEPKYELINQSSITDNTVVKEILTELPVEKCDIFKSQKEKRISETSGTEDSSSSSSDYKMLQKPIVLRHGDSIEDIEQLLQQKDPNIDVQKYVPFHKQISQPNKHKDAVNEQQKSKPFRKQVSLPTKSGHSALDHFRSGSIDHPDQPKLDPVNNVIVSQIIQHESKESDDLHSSDSSDTISSSSEEDYVNLKNVSKGRREIFQPSKSGTFIEFQEEPEHRISSTGISSKDEPIQIDNLSIDHCEKFANSITNVVVENQKRPIDKQQPERQHSYTSSLTLSSSSDEEENKYLDRKQSKPVPVDHQSRQSSVSSFNKESDHQLYTFEQHPIPVQKTFNDNKKDTSSSSGSLTLSSSSDQESDHSKKKQLPNVNSESVVKKIRYSSSSSSSFSSSSNEEKHSEPPSVTDHAKDVSIDHREKFDNSNIKHAMQSPRNLNLNQVEHSSTDSDSQSSSFDEEFIPDKYKSIDRREKFETAVLDKTHFQKDRTTDKRKSTESQSSSSDEERRPYKSIDHHEKFDSPKDDDTITRPKKLSTEEIITVDDSEQCKVASIEKMESPLREMTLNNTVSDPSNLEIVDTKHDLDHAEQTLSCGSPLNKSIDRREKFDSFKRGDTIERHRKCNIDKTPSDVVDLTAKEIDLAKNDQGVFEDSKEDNAVEVRIETKESVIKPSSTDIDTSFSSTDESDGEYNKSIDQGEEFQHTNVTSSTHDQDQESWTSSTESDSEVLIHSKSESIDHRDSVDKSKRDTETEFESTMINKEESDVQLSPRNEESAQDNKQQSFVPLSINGTLTDEHLIMHERDDKKESQTKSNITDDSSSDSETLSSSSDNDDTSKYTDHREKFENITEASTIKGQSKLPNNKEEAHTHSSESGDDGSDEVDYHSIDRREKIINPLIGHKINVQREPLSATNQDVPKTDDQLPRHEYVTEKPIVTDSQSPTEQPEYNANRKYETLPVKKMPNIMSMKEKSKSLEKPVEIKAKSMPDISNGGSPLDVVEKKYHEFTETWSRQSTVDDVRETTTTNVNKRIVKSPKAKPVKRINVPLPRGPRPVPSYMSPVNSYPYVPSDREFGSDDSIVTDYSVDCQIEEINPRNRSLPDFIKELSSNKLYKTPPTPPSKPSIAKPILPPRIVDLNYGDETDKAHYPSDRVVRRMSGTSVTTDSSYLDNPALAQKPTKSNLAKLDSLTSLSTSVSTAQSNQNHQSNGSLSKTSSTSASSLDSDSQSRSINNQSPPKPINKPLITANQSYKERSQIINESNARPVKPSANIRQKIPSSSESSEYSSSSDNA